MNRGVSSLGRAALLACLVVASISLSESGYGAAPVARAAAARTPALDQKAVLQLESRIATAQLQRDFAFLESVLAGDMLYIGADGRKAQKQAYLKQIKNNRVYSQYVTKDLKVRMYGDIAVADGLQKVAGVFDGRKTSGSFVSTKVWAFRMNKWQVVHWQATFAPPPGPEMLLRKLHGQ